MMSMASSGSRESSHKFLDAVYQQLGYHDGELLDATLTPQPGSAEAEAWLEKGDWLSLAKKINAEKVFFVKNDPVVIFCELQDTDEKTLLNIFRRAWCMARPQCLFVARPGELRVYSLNDSPARTTEEWETIEPLELVERVARVSEELQAYRREKIESGQLFIEKKFGALEQRADKQLISDLKAIRRALLTDPVIKIKERFVHALIGRSIFVRYLEDRGVLTPEYFRQVAEDRTHPKWDSSWSIILDTPEERDITPDSGKRRYLRVLHNKDFTYALFNQLAEHFNGDMFPRDQGEENAVTQEHLNLLRHFLLGDADQKQSKLFLWAYDFEIIPIELISSIYEEFYHKSDDKDRGTHYTPSVLVEYVLTQLLTPERLATKPKILDFACGSAIFLVQAFRRIVRYQEHLLSRPLSAKELRQILREQIVGIEINEEAVHVAAFSLYLALLHYQEPKDILAQIEKANGEKPLPYLIYDHLPISVDKNHYNVLFQANTFSLLNTERKYLKEYLEQNIKFEGRAEYKRLLDTPDDLPFEPNSFDIVIGNPPWGYLKKQEGTPELREAQAHALRWCDVFKWTIGDNEMSQAFVARASTLLKADGECGLLISTGVLLKRHPLSQKFRQHWLKQSIVKQVVNFTHVREVFFSEAISPFCFVQYQLGEADSHHKVKYWTAKKSGVVDNIQSVILSLSDIHQVRQSELLCHDPLWKVYWWGNHRDAALINTLNIEKNLFNFVSERNWKYGRGVEKYFPSGDPNPSDWLSTYKLLPTKKFQRYGTVEGFENAPNLVHRFGNREIYHGWRLLVERGIEQANNANGRIKARLENEKYCVLNSIHGVNLDNATDWERKVLVGILWSSLARYYFFMTTSSWGPWHHEIHLQDGLLSLPIRFPQNHDLQNRIVQIVDDLRNWNPTRRDLLNQDGFTVAQIAERQKVLENTLDEAIFELYELSEAERDLILDMCETGLEFFYRASESRATLSVENHPQSYGIANSLPTSRANEKGLEGYLHAFLSIWNRELAELNGEFRWRIIQPINVPMLAVVFTTQQKGSELPTGSSGDDIEWQNLLKTLDQTLLEPISPRIYIDGMVRAVTDTDIFIIKRNERRLWTRSLAFEDAEATLLQAMIAQKSMD